MANNLAYYLRKTAAKTVHVKMDQVAELIGEEAANELAIFQVKKSEVRVGRVGRRSTIAATKRVSTAGLAGFDRAELLEAIDNAKGADFQALNKDEEDSVAAGAPDPRLLPRKERETLEARGLVEKQGSPMGGGKPGTPEGGGPQAGTAGK